MTWILIIEWITPMHIPTRHRNAFWSLEFVCVFMGVLFHLWWASVSTLWEFSFFFSRSGSHDINWHDSVFHVDCVCCVDISHLERRALSFCHCQYTGTVTLYMEMETRFLLNMFTKRLWWPQCYNKYLFHLLPQWPDPLSVSDHSSHFYLKLIIPINFNRASGFVII